MIVFLCPWMDPMQVLALNPEILVGKLRFVAAVKQPLLTCKAAAAVDAKLQAKRVLCPHLAPPQKLSRTQLSIYSKDSRLTCVTH